MNNLVNSSTDEAALQQNLEVASFGESGSDVTDVECESDDDVFSLNLTAESGSSDNESYSSTDRKGPNSACLAQIPRQSADVDWDWKSTNLQLHNFIFSSNCAIKTSLDENKTKLEIFQQFFTPKLLDFIARQTNLHVYSSQHPAPTSSIKNDTTLNNTSSEELKVFLATTIVMGVIRKPDLHLYIGVEMEC